VAVHTPLVVLDPGVLAAAGVQVPYRIHLKREDLQPIGSFKLRGAFNKIAQLLPDALKRGVIAYSSGNHAQGVAFAARTLGAKAVIVMPATAPAVKLQATAALGAEIVLVGPSSSERREKAEQLAAKYGYTVIPPYDDPAIIAGAATCGLEIIEDCPLIDCVLAPVGGGGLLGGVSTAIKSLHPDKKIFGVEPALAADAAASFAAKKIVEWTDGETARTLADGLRTQSIGTLNLQHFMRHVDGILTVTEDEMRAAMLVLAKTAGFMPEPSGAVALAAALYHPENFVPAAEVAVVISGGNVDPALRDDILRS
jgi:threonine dehydratase